MFLGSLLFLFQHEVGDKASWEDSKSPQRSLLAPWPSLARDSFFKSQRNSLFSSKCLSWSKLQWINQLLGANLAVLFKYPFPISLCTTGPHQRKKNVSRVLGLGHCSPFWLLPASISTSRSFSSGIFSTVQYTQDSQWQAVCPGYWWLLETEECYQHFMIVIFYIQAVRQLAIFCGWNLLVEDER